MGDFLNKKAKKTNALIDQMTLFEPNTKYNTKASKTEDFSLYTDERFLAEANKAYEKFKKDKVQTYSYFALALLQNH